MCTCLVNGNNTIFLLRIRTLGMHPLQVPGAGIIMVTQGAFNDHLWVASIMLAT